MLINLHSNIHYERLSILIASAILIIETELHLLVLLSMDYDKKITIQ